MTLSSNSLLESYYRINRSRHIAAIRKLVGSHAVAEDIVQEAFIKAWANSDKYQGDRPLANWFSRILYNTLSDYKRKQSRDASIVLDEYSDTVKEAEGRILIEQLINKVVNLQHREVLRLHHLSKYNSSEISYLMKIKDGTIRQIISRFKERVRHA